MNKNDIEYANAVKGIIEKKTFYKLTLSSMHEYQDSIEFYYRTMNHGISGEMKIVVDKNGHYTNIEVYRKSELNFKWTYYTTFNEWL